MLPGGSRCPQVALVSTRRFKMPQGVSRYPRRFYMQPENSVCHQEALVNTRRLKMPQGVSRCPQEALDATWRR